MGYAVVKEAFHNNSQAFADSAIVSELGAATVIFTFGIFIAVYFSNSESGGIQNKLKEMTRFFYSPIFISLIVGISLSFIDIPKKNIIESSFYKQLHLIAKANTFLLALPIGVILYFKNLRKLCWIVLLAVVIKLIIQAIFSQAPGGIFNFMDLWCQIVVMEAAMPNATITIDFVRKFGCDAELTSILIFATFISS